MTEPGHSAPGLSLAGPGHVRRRRARADRPIPLGPGSAPGSSAA